MFRNISEIFRRWPVFFANFRRDFGVRMERCKAPKDDQISEFFRSSDTVFPCYTITAPPSAARLCTNKREEAFFG